MDLKDFLALIHPAIAVAVVFPLIGTVVNRSLKTRQRRLQTAAGGKSKIPPVVGQEHLQSGRILAGAVVGVTLLGLGYPIFEHILSQQVWSQNPFQVIFIVLMFVATIASLVMLYKARPALWRGIFATLTGAGLVIIGSQDGVFRRTNEWYWSHYYIGITAALLMVFSLAIVQDIYKDRSNRWRTVHVVLNTIAVLLFIGQGMTGPRDLLEIPLSWQKPYIYSCDFNNKTCPTPPPPPQTGS
jgi:drug/metabolite transporter (DMT)-like permease